MSAPFATAPRWRREPYRVFFPLGFLLVWAGVLHWLLHAAGVLPDYRPVFHAITQIQGFLLSFALGFLFTALPRFTQSAAPSVVEMIVAIAAPIGITVTAWFERFAESQIFWFVLVAVLLRFVWNRPTAAGAGGTTAPPGFVWVPLSFLLGAIGSGLIGAYGILGDAYYGLHELGRLFLLQGLFVGLVCGVGSTVLPLFTRGTARNDRVPAAVHALGAVVLALSLWIEHSWSLRGGLALRAALVATVLFAAGASRRPTLPGLHRRLVLLAAWMIPVGYAVAAVFPLQKKAGLHVVFISGFALLALSVGLHVTLGHGGYDDLVRRNPRAVALFGVLIGSATILRALVDFDPERFFLWIGASAAVFLAGSLAWACVVLPRILRVAPDR